MPIEARQLSPQAPLASLLKACEKTCVSECCGIDAFNFSPLHAASHLSAYSGVISDEDIVALEAAIDALVAQAESCDANPEGFVCSIEGTNQLFRLSGVRQLSEQLKFCIRSAPKVLDFANRLQDGGT